MYLLERTEQQHITVYNAHQDTWKICHRHRRRFSMYTRGHIYTHSTAFNNYAFHITSKSWKLNTVNIPQSTITFNTLCIASFFFS